MTEKKDNSFDVRSRYERSWDLLAELWLDQEADKAYQELEELKAAGNSAEMDAFFERNDVKYLRLIEKRTRHYHSMRTTGKNMPRIIQVAAAVIAIISLAGSIAIAASPAVRMYLTNLLIRMTPEYISLKFVEDNSNELTYPSEWKGKYYPSSIPDGLAVDHIENVEDILHSVCYTTADSEICRLEYSEMKDGIINLDSEDAEINTSNVLGHEATVILKEDMIHIYWFDGETLYLVYVKGYDEDEALSIANSLKLTK